MRIGEVIQERYKVESLHSDEGGMGSVVLVSDLRTGTRPLALKFCKEQTITVAENDPVGAALATVILQNPEHFLKGIEPVNIRNSKIRGAIGVLNKPMEELS